MGIYAHLDVTVFSLMLIPHYLHLPSYPIAMLSQRFHINYINNGIATVNVKMQPLLQITGNEHDAQPTPQNG